MLYIKLYIKQDIKLYITIICNWHTQEAVGDLNETERQQNNMHSVITRWLSSG